MSDGINDLKDLVLDESISVSQGRSILMNMSYITSNGVKHASCHFNTFFLAFRETDMQLFLNCLL